MGETRARCVLAEGSFDVGHLGHVVIWRAVLYRDYFYQLLQ